jgi:hypothetical protein
MNNPASSLSSPSSLPISSLGISFSQSSSVSVSPTYSMSTTHSVSKTHSGTTTPVYSMSPTYSGTPRDIMSPSYSMIPTHIMSTTYTVSPANSVSVSVSVSVSPANSVTVTVSPTGKNTQSSNTSRYSLTDQDIYIIIPVLLFVFVVNVICSMTWYNKYKTLKDKYKGSIKQQLNPLHSNVRDVFGFSRV